MAYSSAIVSLIGHLGGDPKEVENPIDPSKKYVEFSLATNLRGKSESVIWWYCSIYDRKTSEFVQNYLKKGRLVAVYGEIRDAGNYVDKKDGSTKNSLKIKVYNVTALDSPNRDRDYNYSNKPNNNVSNPVIADTTIIE